MPQPVARTNSFTRRGSFTRTSSFGKAGKMLKNFARGTISRNSSFSSRNSTRSGDFSKAYTKEQSSFISSGLTEDQRDEISNSVEVRGTEIETPIKIAPIQQESEEREKSTTSKHKKRTSQKQQQFPSTLVVPTLEAIPKLLVEGVLHSNQKVVESAIDKLARHCRKSADARRDAYRAGGHAVIVMAMRTWRTSESIQAGGCRCITNMTCQFLQAKKSFAMIGGIESVLVAMRAFPKSQSVQCYGSGALMNMLVCKQSSSSSYEPPENDSSPEDTAATMAERFVRDMDGIASVVAAMKKFPADAKIQLGGCGLFQNLASQNPEFMKVMMQYGALGAVGASLESHPHDANIKSAAGSFMKKVFS